MSLATDNLHEQPMGCLRHVLQKIATLLITQSGPKSEALLGFDSEALVCTMIGIF